LDLLVDVQTKHPEIIDPSVDVYEEMGISRSFRRGATTHARNMGVSEADIDSMNRWRKFEAAKGGRPSMAMRDHYSAESTDDWYLLAFSESALNQGIDLESRYLQGLQP
jgi:hypothetical protein